VNNYYLEHLERVTNAAHGTYGLSNLATWMTKHTYLNGNRFSFKDHEFQQDILADTSKTTITIKIAQVGLSELSYRWALSACTNIDNFTVIYTFPSATDALNNCKTRIDPIIAASPELRRAVHQDLNNAEIKQFNANSFLYMKGTRSQSAAVSVPADCIIHDEWDRSDINTGSMYIARLQHKPHKLRKIFSTPTVAKFGVSKEAETAKRYRHLCKCLHCNHIWMPDYFNDIKIPDFSGDLREITRLNIKNYRWKEAKMVCPHCGKDPELSHERLKWVAENPGENYEANAYYVSPFSAPRLISPSYLIHVSTQYEKYSEFMNQGLGLTAEDDNESITESDVERMLIQADLNSSALHCMGADMGLTCHIMIGRQTQAGELIVVHREKVPYTNFERRRLELCAQYRVRSSVHDYQPYTDMITRITDRDAHAFGAMYVSLKSAETMRVVQQEEDKTEGKVNIRMVKVNRNAAFDALLGMIKRGEVVVAKQAEDDDFKQQMQSLKRVQQFDRDEQAKYAWVKTDGNDHYHNALLYLQAAVFAQAVGQQPGALSVNIPILRAFRLKSAV